MAEPQQSVGERSEGAPERTAAVVRRTRWPGWIWSVPVAAVGILLWLAVRFFFTHGAEATVYFDTAPGVSAQNTIVTYRGVQIGRVSNVELTSDGERVRLRLTLDRSTEKYLRSGTRFWLQGLSSDLADMPSLMAMISGPTVMMEPGPGAPQHVFTGLSLAPAFPLPTAGTAFTLLASTRGSAQQGSSVYYLGLKVGKVTGVRFVPPQSFRIEVLVQAPYDRLVHPQTRFWDAGAIELSFTNGVKLQLLSPFALLEGAIAFTTPPAAARQARSGPGEIFTLYPDRAAAELAPVGPQARYAVLLPGAVGDLKVGAAVKLRGFVVGAVRDVGFQFDVRTGALRTPVVLQLNADRLRLTDGQAGNASLPIDDAGRLNVVVARLVHAGLRARLARDPPFVGPSYVSLDLLPQAHPAVLDTSSDPPQIPAAPAAGLTALASQLGQLPIRQIGDNVRTITARVRALTTSPRTQQSLDHVARTLAGIDQMVQQAKPQVGPLIANLRRASGELQDLATSAHQTLGGPDEQGGLHQTLDEIERAARSMRSLADYLERHPASLLRGKSP